MTSETLASRAEWWARTLTAIPSVTGTADEAAFADRLVDLIRETPALAAAEIEVVPVPGDPHPRKVVLALLRGEGPATLVLTGHYDVVEIDSYGPLRHLAYDPDRLLPALIDALASEPETEAGRRALAELRSGRFLPGRGLLDMKSGLAAALAVIEAFASEPNRVGNLLFVAVPDEEANSAGARAAAPAVRAFAERRGLDLAGAINLDAIADDGDGSAGRVAAMGTIGKLLPTALVVGRAAHASYTFRGLGAAALAGAIAAELEWLPELTERLGTEVAAGPTLLGMKDTRVGYDVTMPERVWMYWNVALIRRGPREVLDIVRAAIVRAAGALVKSLGDRRAASGGDGGPDEVRVMTFAQLRAEVEASRPGAAAAIIEACAGLAEQGTTLPEQCRIVTERFWNASGLAGAAVILGFGSTPYVPVMLGDGPSGHALDAAIRAAIASTAAATGVDIGIRPFFPAISDVSFFGEVATDGFTTIAANTPVWETVLAPGGADLPSAGIPTVNIGPWGRDYHSRVERLDTHYAFAVLPLLLLGIARELFAPRSPKI